MKFPVRLRGTRTRRRLPLILAAILALALAAAAAAMYVQRGAKQATADNAQRAGDAVPLVAVVPVRRSDLSNGLTVAAEFRPFQEIDVHARVAGYVREMQVDVGDRVKAGAVLAVLEIPELQDELLQASAGVERAHQEVVRAKAAYDEAHLIHARLSEVLKQQPDLVAQQEIDAAQARDATTQASWEAAQSAVREALAHQAKFKDMVAYSRITAPFAGVVSKRYTDTGALVGAGTAASQALVRLSQLDPLRLVVPVPESAVSRIHSGDPVEVLVQATKQSLSATVTRLSGEVETETRTMHVEVDVPNPRLALAPGMYASAVLVLEARKHVPVIPVEAVPNRKDTAATVLVLDKQHRIEERRITIGMETSTLVEVTSGLEVDELVVLGGHGQYQPGQLAEPKLLLQGNPQ